MTISLILVVAAAENGVIGRDNRLLWRLRTDLKRFRDLTMGKPMIMGRKTYQSIGKPLPGRETIVLTRDEDFSPPGVHVVHSWNEAVAKGEELGQAMGADAIAVVGGAEIYRIALPHVQKRLRPLRREMPSSRPSIVHAFVNSRGSPILRAPMTSIHLPLLTSKGVPERCQG